MLCATGVAACRAVCFDRNAMTKPGQTSKPGQASKPGKAAKQAARSERLSASLRENLKRRKEQARGRAGSGLPGPDSPAKDSAETEAPDFRRNRGPH
jgi:hypothetical protein